MHAEFVDQSPFIGLRECSAEPNAYGNLRTRHRITFGIGNFSHSLPYN